MRESDQAVLGDYLSIGAFTKTFPTLVIKRALKQAGRSGSRERSLPNHLVIYYVMSMTMLSAGYCEVMRWLLEGMRYSRKLAGQVKPMCTSGITQARQRVGWEPFKILFDTAACPIATEGTKGAWYKGLRLVSVDGSTVDVADTEENREIFGSQNASRGKTAFPKLRFVSLIEIGTKAPFAVSVAGYTEASEIALARQVIDKLSAGMLCLADRYYTGPTFIKEAIKNGADVLWRAKSTLVMPVENLLSDGSYLTTMYKDPTDRRLKQDGVRVRVIEYKLSGREREQSYRLVTTLLNEKEAPAIELAALYHERWEIETALDELKTHLRGSNVVLRSKTPDLVRQEFYGLMLSYYTVRAVMHDAALKGDEDPDRLSFVHAVRVIKRAVPRFGFFPPEGMATPAG